MALSVTLQNRFDRSIRKHVYWHITDGVPNVWQFNKKSPEGDDDESEVPEFVAVYMFVDGDEMEYIRENFDNIPLPKANRYPVNGKKLDPSDMPYRRTTMQFSGDVANLIWMNL